MSCHDISWEYNFPVDHFYAECSYDSSALGTGKMRFMPSEAKAEIPSDMREHSFGTNTEFCDNPFIYFHIKGVWNNLESAWSKVFIYQNEQYIARSLPVHYNLHPNYPNPFNPSTKISFDVPVKSRTIIKIFNIKGELVKNLVDDIFEVGTYSLEWDGTNDHYKQLGSGIYFCKIRINDFVSSRKMVLLR
jgi:hypothetical protein